MKDRVTFYTDGKTERMYFIPYIQIGIEVNTWANDFFIEIGWLNRWMAVEIKLCSKKAMLRSKRKRKKIW